MLSSIHPLGERSRGNRWWLTVSGFLAGSAVGGLAAGALAGLVGRVLAAALDLSPGVLATAVVLVLLVAILLDLHLSGFPLPTIRRQVNEDWLNRYRGWVY